MSKVLEATCNASGEVQVGDVIVSEAIVLSLGKQASSGLILIDRGQAWYLPSSATDIETTLAKVSLAIDKIGSILNSIGAGMTGPTTAPPPTLPTDVAALLQIKAELDQLKGALK